MKKPESSVQGKGKGGQARLRKKFTLQKRGGRKPGADITQTIGKIGGGGGGKGDRSISGRCTGQKLGATKIIYRGDPGVGV